MKNILLVCSSGLSTNMFVSKLEKSAKLLNFNANIWSCNSVNFKEDVCKADVILLAPQVKYLFDDIKKIVDDDKYILLIGLSDYSCMNSKKILEDVISYLQ